ncbi:MAG: diguanylate cyclase [Piscinibacter sp.]|nr:diguanylate cyclase [Piscinibacter sp.]
MPLYQSAIDAMDAGIVLWDAQDRLVLCNRQFRWLYEPLADLVRPGVTFENLLRAAIARGVIEAPRPDVEGFVAARLLEHREPQGPLLREMPDGRWRRITEQRLADGSLLAFSIDVTALVEKERALEAARAESQHARKQLQDAIDALPEGFALYDTDDRLVACNERYREIYASSAASMQPGTPFEEILRYGLARGQYPAAEGDPAGWLRERLHQHRHPGEPLLQELPGNRWLRIDERRTRQGGVAGVRTDVTELVQREQQLRQLNHHLAESRAQLQAVISTALAAILTVDASGLIRSANPATARVFGWEPDELAGRPLALLVPDAALHLAAGQGVQTGGDLPARHRDGRSLTVHLALSRLNLPGPAQHVALITDLTEREVAARALREANQRLAQLSETDALTGIANRRLFERRLTEEWQRCARRGESVALLLVDVDHFKRYNDAQGHVAGDHCLAEMAAVLRSCARRAGDLVARWGGEEFALLLPGAGVDEALAVGRHCVAAVAERCHPHPDSSVSAHVSISVGVCSVPADANMPVASLVARADAALYAAKHAGRNRAALAPD